MLDTLRALWHYIHITKENDMAIKFLFFIFILIFIASFGLFVTGALMFGPIDVGTILALVCTLGSFAGVTTLGKEVTQNR